MAELKTTKLLGLNFTTNPKDLKDHELSDMTNLQLLKTGDLVRRKGLRPVNSSELDNFYPDKDDADKVAVIKNTSRIKYRQIYTTDREYLDVFAIDNKVYTYDQDINRFNLLYEAPGSAEVDITDYLGYVLVTSQDSNLAVLRKFDRNVYLIDPGVKIIKSKGTISGKEIDFETEDDIVDGDLVDMDIDQVNLYTVTNDGAGATIVEAVTPSGQEISNVDYGDTNTHYNDAKVFIGHDLEYAGEAVVDSGDGLEDLSLANDFSADDAVRDASDVETNKAYIEIDVKSYIGHAYKIVRKTSNGVYNGFVWKGNRNSGEGVIYYNSEQISFPEFSDFKYNTTLYFFPLVTIKFLRFGNQENYLQLRNVIGAISPSASGSFLLMDTGGTTTDGESLPFQGTRTYFLEDDTPRFPIGTYAFSSASYLNRLFELQVSKLQYKLDIDGSILASDWQDSRTFSEMERTTGSTTYKLTTSVPNEGEIPSHLAMLTFNANQRDLVEGIEDESIPLNTLPDDGNTPTSVMTWDGGAGNLALAKVHIYAYKPYYRVESIFSKEQNVSLLVDDLPEFLQSITVNITKSPFILDTSFDISFDNQGSDSETEYALTPPSTDIDTIQIKQYNKDNFDLSNVLSSYLAETTTVVAFAKNERMFILVRDSSQTDPYLMVFKHEDGFRVLDVVTLDEGTDGDFVNLKSFVSHTGRQYISLLTTTKILLYRFEFDKIVSINSYTLPNTPSDVTYIKSDNETQVYVLQDDADTTLILRLIDDQVGDVEFNDDIPDEDYFVNYSADYPDTISFVRNDSNNLVMIVNKTVGTPNGDKYYAYTIDSGTTANYTKAIADTAISSVQQVKPLTTPPKPTWTTGGTGLTGEFVYFYVVKEYNADNVVIYESYPSVFSNVVSITNSQVTLDAKTASYTAFNNSPASVRASVYRAKLESITKIPKLTDFYNLAEIGSGTIGVELTMTDTDEDGVYDIPAVIDDADDTTDLVDLQKYIGFTEFYPRCKFVEVFNNTIYVANDRTYPNNIYNSDIFDPTSWQPQNTLAAEAFTNDAITGIIKNDGLYVFTRDSVSYVNGDGTNVILQTLTREVGCVDPRTLQLIQNHILFLSERGFYWLRQNNYETFDTAVSKVTHKFTFGTEVQTYYDNFTQEYRVVYDDNKILVYSLPLKTWFRFEYPYDRIMIGFTRENRETDIPENVLVVRNEDADGNDVYRLLVEDKLITYDFIRGEATGTVTQNIESSLYTKAFEMENPYAEKIWRRIFLDTVFSHNINGYISNDFGEFAQLVQQRKRAYFNDVPLVWFRFADLFGTDLYDYGSRGVSGITHDVLKNQDGKIDRCYKFEDGAYCNIKDIPLLQNGFTILIWFKAVKPQNTLLENQIIFTDGAEIPSNPNDSDYEVDTSPFAADTVPYTDDRATDGDISHPVVIQNDANDLTIKVGTHAWEASAAVNASDETFTGQGTGFATYNSNFVDGGQVTLETTGTWDSFLSGSDGIKTIEIPVITGVGNFKIGSTFIVS